MKVMRTAENGSIFQTRGVERLNILMTSDFLDTGLVIPFGSALANLEGNFSA